MGQCGMSKFPVTMCSVKILTAVLWRYDEGTALMPVVSKKRLLPESEKFPFMALDEDGYDLPPDWQVFYITPSLDCQSHYSPMHLATL
jgi:hypothetical protein